MVYERTSYAPRPQNQRLHSWLPNVEYRYTDIFPDFSRDGRLVVTDFEARLANPESSISIMAADGANKRIVFQDKTGAAYAPSWSPDGQWLAFGFGGYFASRAGRTGTIMVVRADERPGSRARVSLPFRLTTRCLSRACSNGCRSGGDSTTTVRSYQRPQSGRAPR